VTGCIIDGLIGLIRKLPVFPSIKGVKDAFKSDGDSAPDLNQRNPRSPLVSRSAFSGYRLGVRLILASLDPRVVDVLRSLLAGVASAAD
jgi:hypothetical protein